MLSHTTNSGLDNNPLLPTIYRVYADLIDAGLCSCQFFMTNNDQVFEAFILRGGTPVRVGFILWTQVNEIKSVILNLTYVLPEFRGSGISKAMLEAFEEFILAREESRNINRLCSYINKNNTRMLALAESTGRKIDSLYTTRVIR